MNNIVTTYTDNANKDFVKIKEVLASLSKSGVLAKGQGHCVSMSTMVQSVLKTKGINSVLTECTVVINDPKTNQMHFIGFDNPASMSANTIDTHVVVVTQTTPAFLIDTSVRHRLPGSLEAVVEPVGAPTLAIVKHPDVDIVYEQKNKYNLPALHQQSIVNRIQTDQQIFKDIQYLKYLNYTSIFLSLFAAINLIAKFLGIFD